MAELRPLFPGRASLPSEKARYRVVKDYVGDLLRHRGKAGCRLFRGFYGACVNLGKTSQPELGGNPVSLRAPNRPLSGSVAFLGHLGLNTVQKSKGEAKNPLNGARQ
jgi:hypothetical protein